MKILFLLLIFSSLAYTSILEEDPNDPTAVFRHAEVQTNTVGIDDPSLKLILRRLFQQLNVEPLQRSFFSVTARLSLTSYNMALIADFLESDEDSAEVRDKVRNALYDLVEIAQSDELSLWHTLQSVVRPWLIFCNVIILIPASVLILRALRPRSYLFIIIFAVVVFSVFTTYNRMYEEKLAERLAASESAENACAPATLLEQAVDIVSGFVAFKKKSKCLAFVERQTVSIVNEISLVSVFADVLSHGIFGFLSNCGTHINKFVKDVFTDMPMQGVIIITFGGFILFIGSLLMVVQIRIPFLLSTEPILLPLLREYMGSSSIQSCGSAPAIASASHQTHKHHHLPQAHRAAIEADSHSQADDQKVNLSNVTERSPQRRNNLRQRGKARNTEEAHTDSADDEREREPSADSRRSIRASSPP